MWRQQEGEDEKPKDAIWIDVGENLPRADLGTLKYGLVGSWRSKPDYNPTVKDLEAWARVAWRLKGDVMFLFLNNDLLFLEFTFPEEANCVLESGRRSFRGGEMNPERWCPRSRCVNRKDMVREACCRVVGFPLRLWTREVLKMIGDSYGDFTELGQDTTLRTKVL